jgi:hypothetical protein
LVESEVVNQLKDGGEKTLNTKIKAFTIILVSVVASMLIYLPFTYAAETSGEVESDIMSEAIQESKPLFSRVAKFRFVKWFLNNSEPVEIEGTVVLLSEKMLIVDTAEDQIRVHLPAEWTVGDELTLREELFACGYLSEGENITVKALGVDVIDKEGLRIYLVVGYEIINESGVHAYANLHVNIED